MEYQMLKEVILQPEVIAYIENCIKFQRLELSPEEVQDIRQDIIVGILLQPKDISIEKGWKAFMNTTVRNHLIDLHRVENNKKLDIANGDIEDLEDKIEIDQFATPENHDEEDFLALSGVDIIERLKSLFKQIFNACYTYGITSLPVIDQATIAHLKNSAWAEKWEAVWKILRTEDPTPSNREIAKRLGMSDKTVAKAIEKWEAVEKDFHGRVGDQWNALDNRGKIDWLRNVLGGYINSIQEEIRKAQADLEREEYRQRTGLSESDMEAHKKSRYHRG